MVPGLSSVAALWDPISGPSQVAISENAARTMKLKLQILEVANLLGCSTGRSEGFAVEAGGLMSYGPSLPAMWEQDGALVAKVLHLIGDAQPQRCGGPPGLFWSHHRRMSQ